MLTSSRPFGCDHFMMFSALPPLRNGMTTQRYCPSTNEQCEITRFGCDTMDMDATSLRISSRCPGSWSSRSSIFTATVSPSGRHSARYTFALTPRPISSCTT
jgi:hypothetical protein